MNKKTFLFCAALPGLASFRIDAQTAPMHSWTNLPIIARPVFKKDTVTIVAYEAKPDGVTLNTKAINMATSACSQKEGGIVLVPSGLCTLSTIIRS